MRYAILFLTLFSFASHQQQKERIIAVKNVNVIALTNDSSVISHTTVIIRNNRIAAIGANIPAGATVIDGTGKWLIPGLIDMHVHLPTDLRLTAKIPTEAATIFFNTQNVMTPYIANGVTTVFDLNSRAEHFAQRNEIAHGSVIGPRMALAALINGGEGTGRNVNNPADGRQAVRSAKAEGYEFIKVYSNLDIETYKAIIDEAYKQGMKTIGHIPNVFHGKIEEVFVPNFGMVAHAEEFSKNTDSFSEKDAIKFARLSKGNGTWLSPTLTTMKWIYSQAKSLDELRALPTLKYVHPLLQSKWLTANSYNRNSTPQRVEQFKKMVDFHKLLVKTFKAAGVPIVAGTDAGASGVVGGFSLHDEIELLVEAGLSPGEALASATRLPATWLGIDSLVGTIAAGKYADMVLLNANPMTDIKNTRKIAGVFVNGQWISSITIKKKLSDLEKVNDSGKNDFDWKQTIKQP